MNPKDIDILRFQETYFEKIWGGAKLREQFGKAAPAGTPIGEVWLVSDHANCESAVAEGPWAGKTLRQLLEEDAPAILGSRVQLTIHGRFPLLLKIIDAAQALSVQVHPDDEAAKRLGEPDVGKTEMWHVLQADPGGELICGLGPAVEPQAFAAAIEDNTVAGMMRSFDAPEDTTVFVSAGTVHAIGAGVVLAEIQQNSDLTYRIYDWARVDAVGKPRELHIDKALKVTHFGSSHGGPAQTLQYQSGNTAITVLGACEYFAGEKVEVEGAFTRDTRGETFHLLLGKTGTLKVRGQNTELPMQPGEALLVPGSLFQFEVQGEGSFLDYYVPDIPRDIIAPLRSAGHDEAAIQGLGH